MADYSLDFSAIDVGYTQKPMSVDIRLKFKMLGHITLCEVIPWINAHKGCYAECQSLRSAAVQFALIRLGSLEYAEEVEKIFLYMLEIGFFDKAAYEADKVLTSKGIVKRWAAAKRNSQKYELPPSVAALYAVAREELEKEKNSQKRKNAQETVSNAQKEVSDEHKTVSNAQKTVTSKVKESKVKESSTALKPNKQTNKAREAREGGPEPEPAEASEPAAADAGFWIGRARESPDWSAIRETVKRRCYFRGMDGGLVDAMTAAVIHGWISLKGIENIRRKARDAVELFERSRGNRGTENGWETVRDKVAILYRERKCEPPEYSRNNPEPPPSAPPGISPGAVSAGA